MEIKYTGTTMLITLKEGETLLVESETGKYPKFQALKTFIEITG